MTLNYRFEIVYYILSCWRLSFVIEDILRNPDSHQKEIAVLERLCKQLANDFQTYTILYLYWINLLRENTVYCRRKANRMVKRHPEIASFFLADVRRYCHEIDELYANTDTLPKPFDVGSLILSNKYLWSDLINNESTTLMLESNMALVFWYADMPSQTFSLLAKGCHSWDLKYHDQASSGHELDLISSLSVIIEDIIAEDSDSGHEFLNAILKEVTKMPLPVFHYIYYAHLDKSGESNDICRKKLLLTECPEIMKLQGSSFENVLHDGVSLRIRTKIKEKQKVYGKYLMALKANSGEEGNDLMGFEIENARNAYKKNLKMKLEL